MDDILKNFEQRMQDKKAAAPKLYRYDHEFRVAVLATDEEDSKQKGEFLVGILKQFSDVADVEKLK